MSSVSRQGRVDAFLRALSQRILVIDGAMGTMLQGRRLSEADYRGERFVGWPCDLGGNCDILVLTQPQIVGDIHREYLQAGADIISTNTFTANDPSQADYGTEAFVRELNLSGATIARTVAEEFFERTGELRFVAGVLGPTNRMASSMPNASAVAAFRNIDFDELVDTYLVSARALLEGGVDVLLIETIFDTLNAKAAILAARQAIDECGTDIPIIISGTITNASGRTLSGETIEAFWSTMRHARPAAVGLNCGLGTRHMRAYIAELSGIADTAICAYPNAGLPNACGEYAQTPYEIAELLREFATSGFVNIVGGCCGTTPEHIRHIRDAVAGVATRVPQMP